jgi:hypothetical protein
MDHYNILGLDHRRRRADREDQLESRTLRLRAMHLPTAVSP